MIAGPDSDEPTLVITAQVQRGAVGELLPRVVITIGVHGARDQDRTICLDAVEAKHLAMGIVELATARLHNRTQVTAIGRAP